MENGLMVSVGDRSEPQAGLLSTQSSSVEPCYCNAAGRGLVLVMIWQKSCYLDCRICHCKTCAYSIMCTDAALCYDS